MTEALAPEELALRKWGQKARALARQRAGSTRIDAKAWWPAIREGLAEGYTHSQIARALDMSDRRVGQIKKEGLQLDEADPTLHTDTGSLSEADRARLLEWSFEGFKSFFERYSGKPFLPHFEPWVRAFLEPENRNLLLNCPPRHAKSTIFSLWIPIWLICRDRNVQIILVSAAGGLPARWARGIADQLVLNHDLVKDFGAFKPNKTEHEEDEGAPWRPNSGEIMVRGRSRVTKGAQLTVQSRGSMSAILGMEADFVIVDDPTSPDIARSELQRVREQDWLTEQVLTRLQPGGRVCVIGQRVGYRDIYSWLEGLKIPRGPRAGEPVWRLEKYPAILDWGGDDRDPVVLWPEVWNYDELMEVYARMGPSRFESVYQQAPRPEGGGLITAEQAQLCQRARAAWAGIAPDDPQVVRVMSVDPSPTQWAGVVVADLTYSRDDFKCDILAALHFKDRKNWPDRVASIARRCEADYLILEDSNFIELLRRDPTWQQVEREVRVIRHKTTGSSKHSAEYGIQTLEADFATAAITFPCGDAEGREMTDGLVMEAMEYPEGTYDILMALWFIKFNWRKLRPVYGSGEGGFPPSFKKPPWRRYGENEKDVRRIMTAYREQRRLEQEALDDAGEE